MLTTPLPPLPLVDGAFIIDNSTLERFTTCRRSYLFYGLHKRELAEDAIALAYGDAIHQALEHRYRNDSLSTGDPRFAPVKQEMCNIAENRLRMTPTPPDDHRTIGYAHDHISAYCEHYQTDPFDILHIEGHGPAVEMSFMHELGTTKSGVEVYWTGRIDLMARRSDNVRGHIDHKTTSIMGPKWFDEFENDQAQLGYAWATWQTTGKCPTSFCINALACRRPTKSGKMFEFDRRWYEVTPERLEEWRENTLAIIEDLLLAYGVNNFYAQTKWCVNKYKRCPYFDVCLLPKNSRIPTLYSPMYRDVTWDPLAPRPGAEYKHIPVSILDERT